MANVISTPSHTMAGASRPEPRRGSRPAHRQPASDLRARARAALAGRQPPPAPAKIELTPGAEELLRMCAKDWPKRERAEFRRLVLEELEGFRHVNSRQMREAVDRVERDMLSTHASHFPEAG
jgi:hypothetical protein